MATPAGEGAVAIVRISGPAAADILARVFRGPCPLPFPRRLRLGRVVREGKVVDTALAVFFPGPSSYTGEDMAELHGHGGLFVAGEVLGAVLDAGARLARPGEFTERAFLNGKMDLTQAEAVMDIIRARSPAALRAAREQLEGALGRGTEELRGRLLELVVHLEAWVDFPEEGIDPASGKQLEAGFRSVLARVEDMLATARTGRLLREGVSLVLYGAPNAGKSSLLNRLLGCERAIVDAEPGTTRDTIEESALLDGVLFRITDTAGLREEGGRVERLGMERARRALELADVAVRVVDASAFPPPRLPPAESAPASDGAAHLTVWNKCDLLSEWPGSLPLGGVAVSCLTGQGIPDLVKEVLRAAGLASGRPAAAAINARHRACLLRVREALGRALEDLRAGRSVEYVASSAREALEALGEITGAAGAEEILGEIFSRFCIGK